MQAEASKQRAHVVVFGQEQREAFKRFDEAHDDGQASICRIEAISNTKTL